jgi:hypothetical protein
VDRRWADRLEIGIVFHIIHTGTNFNVPLSMLNDQIDVLNEAYGGNTHTLGVNTRMQFKIKEVKRIWNSAYTKDCQSEPYLDEAVASGTVINVFTCPDPSYLGWAYLPWSFSEGSRRAQITIHPETMPGGSMRNLNQGDTLVHEMGHYFGLLHTFSKGSCSESDGDKVR